METLNSELTRLNLEAADRFCALAGLDDEERDAIRLRVYDHSMKLTLSKRDDFTRKDSDQSFVHAVPYYKLNRIPLSENEFIGILLKKGIIRRFYGNYNYASNDSMDYVVITQGNGILYVKERFDELLGKLGLMANTLFNENDFKGER